MIILSVLGILKTLSIRTIYSFIKYYLLRMLLPIGPKREDPPLLLLEGWSLACLATCLAGLLWVLFESHSTSFDLKKLVVENTGVYEELLWFQRWQLNLQMTRFIDCLLRQMEDDLKDAPWNNWLDSPSVSILDSDSLLDASSVAWLDSLRFSIWYFSSFCHH